MRQKEGRTVSLLTKVTPEEKAAIDQKMKLAGVTNLRGYLRKMAVDGYIVKMDLSDFSEVIRLLERVGRNVNQISRRCNETRNFYASDLEDIKMGYDQLREELNALTAELKGM